MDNTTEKIARYATSLDHAELTPGALHGAKQRIIDTLGCAIGGYRSEPAQIACRLAAASSGVPSARVLGSGASTSMEMAAFANTVMVRYLDCNDAYVSKGAGHASDMIPALMAVAEAHHLSGPDVLTAMVAAYEVFAALADVVSLMDKGWDQGVFVVLGTAAGAGRLLGLSREQMGNALALAVSANIPTRQTRGGELSMWKGCATAASARAGLFAALLAREGMTGPTQAFEGRHGVWEQVTGPFQLVQLGAVDRPWAVERSNLKYFPAEFHAQAPLWAMLKLREKLGAGTVAAINVQIYSAAYREIGSEPEKWAPRTRETADHSLPYLLAAALHDGFISADTFSESRIADPRLHETMARIRITENAEFTRLYPHVMASEIEVVTVNGARYVERADYPKGHVRNAMTDADIETKFMGLCAGLLTPARCSEILTAVWDLDKISDIGEVTHLVRI